ncbi:MAG: hypothetical protein F9K16_02890 [Thermoanaerobaculia bacterium]|nr:MAG: hypothetical protein F9K16_02890 [Thermoanaerobaculia bacterium]MBZ0100651.1 hypothetical protein [Thermoanaerobaculia bacterium]
MIGTRLWPGLLALLASAAAGEAPGDAPPLPPPDPNAYAIVEVTTAQQLADACWNLASDTAIVIAPGVYDLASVAFPNGVDGRLTVGRYGAPPISNLQIRGATGDPEDVVLIGAGMLDPLVPFGIQIFTATDVTIADLSIRDVYYHAVAIQGDQGAARVRLRHLRLSDAGQQIVKGSGGDADDVTIEYSELFYTAGAIQHPEGSPPGSCYTNAIDAIGSARWIVRDNLVRDIRCANGDLAGPAVLLWQGSSDSRVERNTFLDCSRGVSLGLVGPADHTGGLVRDNFFRWETGGAYQIDVPIYTTSPGSKILHNTALTRGEYPNAIEVRFAGATGVVVRHNLLDAAITPRDGASPTVAANSTAAVPSWFRDLAAGDLHLTAASAPIRDQVARLADAVDDFDAVSRPATGVDLGADEYRNEIVFTDGFESGDTSAWPLP